MLYDKNKPSETDCSDDTGPTIRLLPNTTLQLVIRCISCWLSEEAGCKKKIKTNATSNLMLPRARQAAVRTAGYNI